MTREEAIWWVNHLFEIRKEEYFNKRMMQDAKEVEQAQHMAIEALSEPKIIVGIDTPYGSDKGIATVFKDKDDKLILEEVKEIMGWIPCSERLPSESDDYLCTIPLDAYETYTEVLTFHKGRFYEDDDEWGATYHDDVLAWMPLPTPYKCGEDMRGGSHD